MVVKVKESIECEYKYFRDSLILYTYLHLAADGPLTRALMDSGVKEVAYETIMGRDGGPPCLAPMSEIAGRMAVQEGAKYLEKSYGGRGVLLAGVPGVVKGGHLHIFFCSPLNFLNRREGFVVLQYQLKQDARGVCRSGKDR